MSKLLKEAIQGLGINVPIYRTEEEDGVLILYLYGGRVVRWPPSTMATADAGADFTKIPHIGPATNAALHTAGYLTRRDLVNAPYADLLKVPGINTHTLPKIRLYLYGGIPEESPPSTMATADAGAALDPVTTSPEMATTGDDPDPGSVTTSPTLATPSRDRLPDPVTTSPEMEPTGDELQEHPVTIPSSSPTDDLTDIPHIGDATAKALADAGYLTFQNLISAPDTDLLDIPGINTYTLPKIRAYLRTRWS